MGNFSYIDRLKGADQSPHTSGILTIHTPCENVKKDARSAVSKQSSPGAVKTCELDHHGIWKAGAKMRLKEI